MSEAMSLETLAASVMGSHLVTPLTKTRFRIYGPDRGYTDIDALAAAPLAKKLAIAECKAQSGPRVVYEIGDYDGLLNGGYTWSLLESARALFSAKNRWTSPYLQFGPDDAPWSGLEELELWLYANIIVDRDAADAVDARLTAEILAEGIPGLPAGVTVTARARSTLDLVLEGFSTVERWVIDAAWGARSGDPVLDALRELIRYKHAIVSDGGHGASARGRAQYRQAIKQALLDE